MDKDVKVFTSTCWACAAENFSDCALLCGFGRLPMNRDNIRNTLIYYVDRIQKAIVKAKKDTKAAALAASARMVSQNAVAAGSDKELMDLSNQLRTSMRDYNIVNAKISNEEKTLKMAQLTKKEMDELPKDNTKMYRGVGKMFMASSRDEVHTHLANEMKSSDAAITDLGQKRDYLEKRIKSTQQNMKELTKQ